MLAFNSAGLPEPFNFPDRLTPVPALFPLPGRFKRPSLRLLDYIALNTRKLRNLFRYARAVCTVTTRPLSFNPPSQVDPLALCNGLNIPFPRPPESATTCPLISTLDSGPRPDFSGTGVARRISPTRTSLKSCRLGSLGFPRPVRPWSPFLRCARKSLPIVHRLE